MKACEDDNEIINCVEIFTHNNIYFIVTELMDYPLNDIV
jgi:hypothetical protein